MRVLSCPRWREPTPSIFERLGHQKDQVCIWDQYLSDRTCTRCRMRMICIAHQDKDNESRTFDRLRIADHRQLYRSIQQRSVLDHKTHHHIAHPWYKHVWVRSWKGNARGNHPSLPCRLGKVEFRCFVHTPRMEFVGVGRRKRLKMPRKVVGRRLKLSLGAGECVQRKWIRGHEALQDAPHVHRRGLRPQMNKTRPSLSRYRQRTRRRW